MIKKIKKMILLSCVLFIISLSGCLIYANSVSFSNRQIARYQGWNYVSGGVADSSSYSYCDCILTKLDNDDNGVTFYACPNGKTWPSNGTVFTSTGVHKAVVYNNTTATANQGVSVKYRSHDFNLTEGSVSGTLTFN